MLHIEFIFLRELKYNFMSFFQIYEYAIRIIPVISNNKAIDRTKKHKKNRKIN